MRAGRALLPSFWQYDTMTHRPQKPAGGYRFATKHIPSTGAGEPPCHRSKPRIQLRRAASDVPFSSLAGRHETLSGQSAWGSRRRAPHRCRPMRRMASATFTNIFATSSATPLHEKYATSFFFPADVPHSMPSVGSDYRSWSSLEAKGFYAKDGLP